MRALSCDLYSGIGGLVLLALLGTQPAAHATTIKNIYDFDDSSPANAPDGPLIADAAGNLYGVTNGGGTYNHGTVFRLSPPPAGDHVWKLTTLHSFNGKHSDGLGPSGTLAMDSAGNIYGTGMGINDLLDNGFVFKLSPPQPGETAWTESMLHRFAYRSVYGSAGNIIIDKNGNLYSIGSGGASRYGVIFELSPPSAAHTDWQLKILHEFTGPDGGVGHVCCADPLMIDAAGVLYGHDGEIGNYTGTVFQLTPPAIGHTVWKEQVLYRVKVLSPFGGPTSSLIADASGALYGSLTDTQSQLGEIFKLTPPGSGHRVWTKSTIFVFPKDNPYGLSPGGSLAFDSSGALYGQTYFGGASNSGIVYKLTPPATGTGRWSETVLANPDTPFDKANGFPVWGLVAGRNGNIFGVQGYTKPDIHYSVFEITP